MRPDVIDTEDVRMIEGAGRLGFLFKAIQTIDVLGKGSGQHFDGDVAAEFCIACAVNLAHASFAKLGDNCVLSDR